MRDIFIVMLSLLFYILGSMGLRSACVEIDEWEYWAIIIGFVGGATIMANL